LLPGGPILVQDDLPGAGQRVGDRGYQVIQQLPGIGPVLAAVIVAESVT